MAFSTNGVNRSPMAEINVTPLVDVMLVLLIIFMVTAPMMQAGVSVDLPSAKGEALEKEREKKEIIIAVTGEGKIFLNETAVTEQDLTETVLKTTKGEPTAEVFLRADKSVPYGTVVRIMAALKNAGLPSLGMITSPQEDSSRTQ
jgi:biopolymer transport protein TolR